MPTSTATRSLTEKKYYLILIVSQTHFTAEPFSPGTDMLGNTWTLQSTVESARFDHSHWIFGFPTDRDTT